MCGRDQDENFLYSFLMYIQWIQATYLKDDTFPTVLGQNQIIVQMWVCFWALFFPCCFVCFWANTTIKTSKMTIKNMTSQATKWEQAFAKYISNKPLISRICKEFLQINEKTNKQTKNPATVRQLNRNTGTNTWICTFKKSIYKWLITMKRCSS